MQKNEIHRIIDANLNRASEALRVLEDFARFVKNNEIVSAKLKNIRHELNQIIVSNPNLILSRESNLDLGRYIENNSERKSNRDIIRANSKRIGESLRVLSEYGQLLRRDAPLEHLFENFRYEIYTIEKELIINEKLFRLNNAKLYLVAGRDAPAGRLYDDKTFLPIIEKSIEGGIDIIQLREKNENEKKILELAKEIKKLISGTDILFIINDRIDIALACGSDGVHLGQDDMPIEEARKITPEGFIIGLSTHSPDQALHATLLQPDYIGIGPVFPTPTKPDYKPAGLEYVRWANKHVKQIPWFAIGGINESNMGEVIDSGATKIAIVRAIMNAKDPLKTTSKLKTILTKGKILNAETVK